MIAILNRLIVGFHILLLISCTNNKKSGFTYSNCKIDVTIKSQHNNIIKLNETGQTTSTDYELYQDTVKNTYIFFSPTCNTAKNSIDNVWLNEKNLKHPIGNDRVNIVIASRFNREEKSIEYNYLQYDIPNQYFDKNVSYIKGVYSEYGYSMIKFLKERNGYTLFKDIEWAEQVDKSIQIIIKNIDSN
jgi:hypothetical protein